jgi:predicted RNA-binding protein with PIN domain
MHYYIDGYNLLFRISRAAGELQKQRHGIIKDLETKINCIGLDATLVFDAQHYEGESVRRHLNQLEIVFTACGETADEYILDRLRESSDPSKETVATSDKKLALLSRRRHAYTQSIEDFIAWLNKRYRNKLRGKDSKKSPTLQPLRPSKCTDKNPLTAEPVGQVVRPRLNATIKECFEWYLKAFEQSYKDVIVELEPSSEDDEPLYAMPAIGTKRKKKLKKYDNPLVSDMERWLKVFERTIDDD